MILNKLAASAAMRLMNEAAEGADLGGADTGTSQAAGAETLLGAEQPGEQNTEVTGQDGAAAQGAPDAYDFKVPEGFEIDSEVLEQFTGIAKQLGLTQEQAQGVVDLQTKLIEKGEATRQEALQNALDEQASRWADEIKNDPELGGAKFEETTRVALRAVQAFATDDLRLLLNESGIGNHPEMVRLFHAIGLAISEDKVVLPGNAVPPPEQRRAADILFGDIK
jgi:hypothetical protein